MAQRNRFQILVLSLLVVPAISGCASLALQTDDFREKELARGCRTEAQCEALLARALERQSGCKDNTVGYLRCSDTARDVADARAMLRERVDARRSREQKERLQAQVANREARRAEEQRQREERNVEIRAEHAREREARQADLDAQRAKEEHLRSLAQDPEYAVPVLSALLCDSQQGLASAKQQDREQRRVDRRSGVVDLAQRRSDTEVIMDWEQDVKAYRAAIRRLGARPLPCDDTYRELLACAEQAAATGTTGATMSRAEATAYMRGARAHEEHVRSVRSAEPCVEPMATYGAIYSARVLVYSP